VPESADYAGDVADPKPAHVHTLHRYFIWSTLLKSHFDSTLGEDWFNADEGERIWTDDGIRSYAYLSYWYSALYVVVEGWQKLDLHDQRIDELLESPNVEHLKLYRHGVFHFHEDYFNEPLTLKLIKSDDEPVAWVRTLSNELGRWFLEWFESRRSSSPAPA
jgi:hypothetical protein